ncbi:hypothetical protein PILCRDRAFT_190237 [Piloderma croceum F 1598]|uniref:Uncharacterized protein n=1 Tax=Piloderma croceum (strain F 1598) TaxID=765440 RepID=A0A0C3GCW0_PILCF|nr:hypothetical protein PILCRDRAFT_190237 [Piloderma croceum F 1598]
MWLAHRSLPSFGIVKYPSFTIEGESDFMMCFSKSSAAVRMGAWRQSNRLDAEDSGITAGSCSGNSALAAAHIKITTR